MIDPEGYEEARAREHWELREASRHLLDDRETVVGAYFNSEVGAYYPITEEELIRRGKRMYDY